MEAYGNISGVSGYNYDNVSITLKFSFRLTGAAGKDHGIHSITTNPIQLNVGGNGTVKESEDSYNDGTINWTLFEKEVECLGYEIVSVSGTVTPSSN